MFILENIISLIFKVIKILKNYPKLFIIKVPLREDKNRQARRIENLQERKEYVLKKKVSGSFSLHNLEQGELKLIKANDLEYIK